MAASAQRLIDLAFPKLSWPQWVRGPKGGLSSHMGLFLQQNKKKKAEIAKPRTMYFTKTCVAEQRYSWD